MKAWTGGDFDTARSTLHDDVTFVGPLGIANGIDECMQGLRGLKQIVGRSEQRKPRSRGGVRLRSGNPADPPYIDPGYLSDPHDRAVLREGLRHLLTLARTPPLANLVTDDPGERSPERSDPDLDAWLTANVGTYHHPVGTCVLAGAQDDDGGDIDGDDG